MAKLSKEAFAIMAMCEETKKPFGITVNPKQGCYAFTWAFKINPDQAKREGYDISGEIRKTDECCINNNHRFFYLIGEEA